LWQVRVFLFTARLRSANCSDPIECKTTERIKIMSNRPASISIKDIAKAVDHAVRVASEKHKVKFGPEFTINPGLIMGRWLLDDIKMSQAEQIAGEIAQHAAGAAGGADVKAAAGRSPFEPIVLGGRGHVICGFWPGPEVGFRE
jgi:hypothetical protein